MSSDTKTTLSHAQNNIKAHFQQSAKTLETLFSLPSVLKRDLNSLLISSEQADSDSFTNILTLLHLYQRTVKLFAQNQQTLCQEELFTDKQTETLCNELQFLITELDFEGEIGDKLLDIRSRLLLTPSPKVLIDIINESIQLILAGTREERKLSQEFLGQINSELAILQHQNSKSISSTNELISKRLAFHHSLTESISDITSHLNASSEKAEPWQTKMMNSFSQLAIESHSLSAREALLLAQLKQSEKQLDNLQQGTLDYRRRLGQQTQKLLLDPLTKVYNRLALNERLIKESKNAKLDNTSFCLAIIDIDNFKQVNQKFGYAIGDKVLKITARNIYQCLKKEDFIARFCGEKFVILIPNGDKDSQEENLQAIQQMISHLSFKFKEHILTISVSIGATLSAQTDQPNNTIERADRALNKAKQQKTDSIIFF